MDCYMNSNFKKSVFSVAFLSYMVPYLEVNLHFPKINKCRKVFFF